MIYYGKGGWNWSDLYNMPVRTRNYFYNKLIQTMEAEKEELDKIKQSAKR